MQRISQMGRRNPFTELLSFAAAAIVTVVAFLFGAVLLAVIVGLIALGALAFSLRLWWLRRKLQRARQSDPNHPQIIEAEYTVVERPENPEDH